MRRRTGFADHDPFQRLNCRDKIGVYVDIVKGDALVQNIPFCSMIMLESDDPRRVELYEMEIKSWCGRRKIAHYFDYFGCVCPTIMSSGVRRNVT